uniref:Uncharacterized protein n=1 Tax=Brugia timori TaxID=42155 RepID=A0A0R3RCL6_9BILA
MLVLFSFKFCLISISILFFDFLTVFIDHLLFLFLSPSLSPLSFHLFHFSSLYFSPFIVF